MPFASLRHSLQIRKVQTPAEFGKGESLGSVLTRDLLAVEAAADTDMLTSILLLDGNQLRHGAAPNLPSSFCEAIDGVEIGPYVGSCGTAAYTGRPVHVVDIEADPLWADYKDLALAHGLRACWSTPIFDRQGRVVGTFAIYHLEPRAPTADEVEAISAVTDHVARAIAQSRPGLTLVSSNYGRTVPAPGSAELLGKIAGNFEAIRQAIDAVIGALPPDDPCIVQLRRARDATSKGAAWARGSSRPDETT